MKHKEKDEKGEKQRGGGRRVKEEEINKRVGLNGGMLSFKKRGNMRGKKKRG